MLRAALGNSRRKSYRPSCRLCVKHITYHHSKAATVSALGAVDCPRPAKVQELNAWNGFIGGAAGAWPLAARAAAGVAGDRYDGPERADPQRHGCLRIAMRTVRLVLAGAIAALALTLGSQGARAQPNPEPMIFFLAKGERDACGPGCSEWIAAEGMFDGPQVERRF